jgi:hypothetical protein
VNICLIRDGRASANTVVSFLPPVITFSCISSMAFSAVPPDDPLRSLQVTPMLASTPGVV